MKFLAERKKERPAEAIFGDMSWCWWWGWWRCFFGSRVQKLVQKTKAVVYFKRTVSWADKEWRQFVCGLFSMQNLFPEAALPLAGERGVTFSKNSLTLGRSCLLFIHFMPKEILPFWPCLTRAIDRGSSNIFPVGWHGATRLINARLIHAVYNHPIGFHWACKFNLKIYCY